MTITAIKQQERLKGRYSIFVDEKYAFSLSADALLAEGLHSGIEFDAAQLKHYKALSQEDKAYGLLLAYVARRMRSRWELAQYCQRKDYAPELAEQMIAKLERLGLVDDTAFAEAWVRNRHLLKPTSKRRLVQELRQKYVADSTIEAVLAEDETNEVTVLQEVVARKRKLSRYQDSQKLARYLVGQGFSYDDVKAALRQQEE